MNWDPYEALRLPRQLLSCMLTLSQMGRLHAHDDGRTQCGAQVMDTLVKHLPPDATMPVLLERVHVLSNDANHKLRMAAMMALSVRYPAQVKMRLMCHDQRCSSSLCGGGRTQCSIEGARDFLRDHIPALAEIVVAGVRDPIASVREAALVALDEMSRMCVMRVLRSFMQSAHTALRLYIS